MHLCSVLKYNFNVANNIWFVGIEDQVKQMPVRFFAEQIREGCQLVLTGLLESKSCA